VRSIIAVALALAFEAAALGAPLVHAHPDDHATGHHHGRVVHTHWSGHAQSARHPDTPTVETEDHDRPVFVNAFVAVSPSPPSAAGLTPEIFELPVLPEQAAHRRVDDVRSHDPPCFRSLSSRAPPACLS
jgi:hypothetical protein